VRSPYEVGPDTDVVITSGSSSWNTARMMDSVAPLTQASAVECSHRREDPKHLVTVDC